MLDNFLNNFYNNYVVDAYKYFGCHYRDGGSIFRVYAPNADRVRLLGDFNNWHGEEMRKISEKGIWETLIINANINDNYKYEITSFGRTFLKQDPYAFYSETQGKTSSKVFDIDNYCWKDDLWIDRRSCNPIYDKPLNIYEIHLGSWRKDKNNKNLNYRKIADRLIPYIKKMGFTHIEILPLTEHPYDGSWGYQVCGYFSITSRYGNPYDFMYFVEKAHLANIGVIMDWVPAHFPKDDFGLCEFDGTYLYENNEPTKIEYKSWGTRAFNYNRSEVKSFLISSAYFLFEKYHIDGLRVDAVAAMLYLDYDRDEWIPNEYGNNHNLEAIEFLKCLNKEIFYHFPNVLMIAEESTSFPKITHPVHEGGLGFNYKWNMGWMNDSLSYMKVDPIFKKYYHNKMTFSIMYAFSENFILPLSHDEVVHGKLSLLNKMPGIYEDKFANLRAYYGYLITHPGKKLLFMGSEFGQFIEWNYKKELDWLLLDYPMHQKLMLYIEELNKFYLRSLPLFQLDNSWNGFSWINPDDKDNNVLSYIRRDKNKKELIVIINFSGKDLYDYRIGVNHGKYKEVFNSDKIEYGGKGLENSILVSEKREWNNRRNSIVLKIPKFSMIVLKKYKGEDLC